MDLETTQNNAIAKLPLLKQGDYEMWKLRIKQYFQVQDYALWEVIEYGNSFKPVARTTTNAYGSSTLTIPGPVTTEEKAQKKNDVKARSMLLMALPNEHQLTFSQYKDAKNLFESIQMRFGGNEATKKTQRTLLKQMYENFIASSQESLDSISNRLQKIRTGKKIIINGSDTAGYDKSKVECFNCHKMGHFARECRGPRNQRKTGLESKKTKTRTVNVEGPYFQNNGGFLMKQYDSLRVELNKSDFDLATYKRGLASVEEQLIFYKKNKPEFKDYGVNFNESVSENSSNENKRNTAVLTKSDIVPFSTARQRSSKAATPLSAARPINTAAPKLFVNAAKTKPNGDPQVALKDTRIFDSRCSRHMTGNKSFLTDYQDYDGGFVAFAGSSKGGRITSKERKVTQTSLYDKSKLVTSVSQPLQILHMDLFGPTFVKSIMGKAYCLVVIDDYNKFSWVFFLAKNDETSGILKNFITRIENQLNSKVKIIRCDNRTEFKNYEMNQFYGNKGIKREFSNARTPKQNRVAERKNITLIEAARTMVLVTKPHNKTPYELLIGRTPIISFMRPFGCPVTILNILDHLGKFDGKADEGFLVGYSINSKAFRVFNSKTKKSRFRTNGNAGLETNSDARQARKENVPDQDYIYTSSAYKFQLFLQIQRRLIPHLKMIPRKMNEDRNSTKRWQHGIGPGEELTLNRTNNLILHFTNLILSSSPFKTKLYRKSLLTVQTNNGFGHCGIPHGKNGHWIEAIRLFLAFASFMGFTVYQMDVKSAILYGTIEEEVQPKASHMQCSKENHLDILKGQPIMGPMVFWLQNQLLDYGYNFMKTKIHVDNESAICVVKNPVNHLKTKHIKIRHHFIRDSYEKKLIEIVKILTDYNVVDFLTKAFDVTRFQFLIASIEFHQIIDFLTASHIYYALTENPTIYALFIKQFWTTATSSINVNREVELTASIDGQAKTITEASLRRHLKLEDNGGITSLPNTEIFEQLALMTYATDSDKLTFQKGNFSPQWRVFIHTILHCLRPKKTSWEQFSSNIATAIICLATNKTFNFSKFIFDAMCSLTWTYKGSMSLNELMDLVTQLTNKVRSLENELKNTKKIYVTAITKLAKRVKKLEMQFEDNKRQSSRRNKDSSFQKLKL
ncbi:putative ribonuclease H-like domain-containing protein [Tanacetum coccineum]|uniref:Ribonuclease H-like domain-containing protein n=1 Tax=Tanacetum coccineum TaxID=301880 RepID=A0ABQ5BAD4_9ASTR